MKPTAVFKILLLPVFLLAWSVLKPGIVQAATMSLSPATTSLVAGRSYDMKVYINSAGANIVGADAIINYNTSKITIQSITQGSIFSTYPLKTYFGGVLKISGLTLNGDSPFNGSQGLFATIHFRANTTGTANFTFTYTSGQTTDSNVTGEGTAGDLLNGITNAVYTIGASDNNGTLPPTGLFDKWGGVSIVAGAVIILAGFDMVYQVRQNNKKKSYA